MTWEQRWHPLRREWVVVTAQRQNRPLNAEQVSRSLRQLPQYVDLRAVSGVHHGSPQ